MQRNTLKFILDTLLFVFLTSTAMVGLILAFVIPGGSNVPAKEKYFWGVHRHAWGDIHLVLALIFLSLLGLHLFLNWSWIVGCIRKYFGEKWKHFLYVLCGAWLVVIIMVYLFVR